jgi:hypothetical protein
MGRLLIFSIGLSLAAQYAGTTQAQAPPQKQTLTALPAVSDDTLIVGTTTLKLGMPKDEVVPMLSAAGKTISQLCISMRKETLNGRQSFGHPTRLDITAMERLAEQFLRFGGLYRLASVAE